jgi:two-component system, OmpR family, response regulator
MSASAHLALLDDEPDITDLLLAYLGSQGFRVSVTHRGADLLALMACDPPDLVLLDLGLPGEDGFAIARALREHWRCGLIIVSGRGDAIDKVVGLEVGADDYVTKPFDLRELLARIKAVLRRLAERAAASQASISASGPLHAPGSASAPPGVAAAASGAATTPSSHSPARSRWRFAGWELDTGARRLNSPQGEEVPLTTGEFELLLALLQNAGQVLSRDFLLASTRGREAGPFDRTIDVQVGRLRKKIEAMPDQPQHIKSVRGAGYVLVTPVQQLSGVA